MKKIIVIEDDQALNLVITEVLENKGFNVFSTYDGRSGINLVKAILPDLIVCDIMMPGINGYDVISDISSNSSTSSIPFIFLSAMAKRDDIRKGMELGADDYITKPFKIDELVRAIETKLRKQERLVVNNKNEENEYKSWEKVEENGYIFLEVKGQPKLVKVSCIISIAAHTDYTNVFLSNGEKIIVRRLLKKWEEILPGKIFIRIHRSTIINLNYIIKIEKWLNNSLAIFLKDNPKPFIVSRRISALLKSRFHYQ